MLRSYDDTIGTLPPATSQRWSIASAALATSAAPSYFAPFKVDNLLFQDAGAGGFNNPVAAAVAEAGWIIPWSKKSIAAIVSIGTGLTSPTANLYPPVKILPEAVPPPVT